MNPLHRDEASPVQDEPRAFEDANLAGEQPMMVEDAHPCAKVLADPARARMLLESEPEAIKRATGRRTAPLGAAGLLMTLGFNEEEASQIIARARERMEAGRPPFEDTRRGPITRERIIIARRKYRRWTGGQGRQEE